MPSPAPRCSKTTDDGATSSTTIVPSVKNRSESEGEMNVSIDEANVDATDGRNSEEASAEEKMDVEEERMDTSAVEETCSVASGGVKDRVAEGDRTVAEACKKRRDQEDTYKIEFVRRNGAYVHSPGCFAY